MKLILNMYDHDVVMHMKFHQGGISHRGVIALCHRMEFHETYTEYIST